MFTLKNKFFALYGDIQIGARTSRIVAAIESCGLQVRFIIDKKFANSYNAFSTKISLEDFESRAANAKNKWVIVLCFFNISTHMVVSESLHRRGFDQLVFVPGYNVVDYNQAHTMRSFFNRLLYGNICNEELLPDYIDLCISDAHCNEIISKYGGGRYVSIYAPITLLYIGIESENFFGRISDEYLLSVQDKHISAYETHNELFRYVFCGGNWPEHYANHFSFGRDPQIVVEDRKKVFTGMLHMTFNDPNYWRDAPLPVKWNPIGHFNLLDGHHRASFLYNFGARRVPVVMTDDDFCAYRSFVNVR